MTWPSTPVSAPTTSADRWLYMIGSNTSQTAGTTPTVTWSKPAGRGMFLFALGSAGGGGGGGANRFGGLNGGGGGGGGPGLISFILMPGVMVPDTLGLVIGQGGGGGAGGPGSTTTAGTNGTVGGSTALIAYAQGGSAVYTLFRLNGGAGGGGGLTTGVGGTAGAIQGTPSATDWSSCGIVQSFQGTAGTAGVSSGITLTPTSLQCGGAGGGQSDGEIPGGSFQPFFDATISSAALTPSPFGAVFRQAGRGLQFFGGIGGNGSTGGSQTSGGAGSLTCGGGGGGGADSTLVAGSGGRGGDGFVWIAAL